MSILETKVTQLRNLLREMSQVVVCFSGGVDSSYLLAEGVRTLGADTLALTAVSPSLAPEEGVDAQNLAKLLGARHLIVNTLELDDPRYAANPFNRCYFCKTELYTQLTELADKEAIQWVVNGTNTDDQEDYRPGMVTASEHQVRSPLVEAGLTKA
ncbi:MAG: TIGR00268 family protein, partial [Deltaproteobacteria bacterium]|nr:TIGR00268 family protein [Deltaproteobacteria bacterium]